jgi:mannitol/fructose-specific phosphotransferase system IIA component (Ntr-type)/predicted transcriptional regulator
MKLNSIINEDLVFCGVEGSTREEVYGSMLKQALVHIDSSLTVEELLAGIIDREDVVAIPYEGMALPHLRNPELNDLFVIIGILKEPVKLKPVDITPTRLVVMSLISKETSDIYLKSLAAFARFFSKPDNIKKCDDIKSPRDLFALLEGLKVKEHVMAEDIMCKDFPKVKADDYLSKALDIMETRGQSILPVVDVENNFVGKIDATEVLKGFVPEYLLMMDNLKFISSFEMFDKFFKEEGVRFVKDFMISTQAMIAPNTPLIQFTVTLAKREADMIFVVDDENKLCGVISIKDIIHKILRG